MRELEEGDAMAAVSFIKKAHKTTVQNWQKKRKYDETAVNG